MGIFKLIVKSFRADLKPGTFSRGDYKMDEMFQWEFCQGVGQLTLIEKEVVNTQEEFLSPFIKVRVDTTTEQNSKDGLI